MQQIRRFPSLSRLCLGIILGLNLCLASSLSQAAERITLATGERPPYISAQLKHGGFVMRIVREAFAAEGVEANIRLYPWPRAIALLQSGKADAGFAYSRSPERDALFHYSEPIIESHSVFFHLKSVPFTWQSYENLAGLRIGANSGHNNGAAFDDAEKRGIFTVDRTMTEETNFTKLLAGRIDLVLATEDVGEYVLQTRFADRKDAIASTPRHVADMQDHLIVARTHPRAQWLIDTFNRGLKKLKAQGKIREYTEESRRGDYLLPKPNS